MNDWNKQIIAQFHANGGKNVSMFGDNLLLLKTTGVKSGEERINPLAFSKDANRYVIIASYGGAPKNPAWYHNLVNNPVTTIEVGSEKLQVRASEVKGEKRDQLYAAHAALFPTFNEYQEKTTRKIPVILLERVTS